MIITVTGHRPDKLGNAYNVSHPTNLAIGKKMREFILSQAGYDNVTQSFVSDEVVTLISGMALGVDTIWALVALKLRKRFSDKFRLECAIPCKNHSSRWNESSKKQYADILLQADVVTHVSTEPYKPSLMQKRNEYMVDKADLVFAVWDGSNGGTGNCVKYAKEQKRTIFVLHPFKLTVNRLAVHIKEETRCFDFCIY
ncbi:SLOG family protein (plasmid) [Aneurinibacillus sp. Ricciae_BoGa-3]|uniref:SLOG family protein n=1 Tax=Aneurinibacillus sp. Ricciae_BoGa-3 TaxID=3022697 RepID=UPI00233F7CC4|nr:SLOG family protein [Aneurinibacillus sp. Ricciae_BoGa-3]WCK56973.1 SLOG family protein [Aneurinibacillus sp. Ricciae_BoGa-3]